MNERPITTGFLRRQRNPLLWAALCSLLLHTPLMFVLSPFWDSQAPDSWNSAGLLQVGLVPAMEPEPDTDQEILSADVPEPWTVVEAVPAETVQSDVAELPPHVAPSYLSPSLESAASVVPSPASADDSAVVVSTDIEAVEADNINRVADSTEPVPDFPPTISAADLIPPTAQPIPMSSLDVRQIETALQTLTDRLNGPEFALETAPAPEMLGLPASDVISVSAHPVNDLNSLRQVDVTVTRQIDGMSYQVHARLQERALSYYAKFINRWDDNVMLSNDRVDGRFHVNSAVNFETSSASRPQFNGEVTIASRQSVPRRLRQTSMFANGLRSGVGRISLPDEILPAHWLDAGATVLALDSDARLEFVGSAGVIWTDLDSDSRTQVAVPPAGLIITGPGRPRIELSGSVAGNVLVHSGRQLLITGNLTYHNQSPESSDSLALISEGSIEIAPASVTGAGGLEIHGALYAKQRFSVRRFRDRHQGTLYIYGTLVAGSVSATEPRFHTHIEYDNRFINMRPPAFPSTGLVDLVQWDQQWAAVTDSDALLADAEDNAPIAAP